jgi:hypothetical protein
MRKENENNFYFQLPQLSAKNLYMMCVRMWSDEKNFSLLAKFVVSEGSYLVCAL